MNKLEKWTLNYIDFEESIDFNNRVHSYNLRVRLEKLKIRLIKASDKLNSIGKEKSHYYLHKQGCFWFSNNIKQKTNIVSNIIKYGLFTDFIEATSLFLYKDYILLLNSGEIVEMIKRCMNIPSKYVIYKRDFDTNKNILIFQNYD